MIPLWVVAPKVPAREVFGMEGFANYGGWSSVGAACVIGQLAAGGALLGADSAAHMSEEVSVFLHFSSQPSRLCFVSNIL